MTRYFVDGHGNYLGGFDGATPPPGAVEVPAPPPHGLDRWDGEQWLPHAPPPAKTVEERLAALGLTVAELKAELAK